MATESDVHESPAEQAFDYDRTVALSDGVFAIALTLLVLTISFPALSGPARHRLGTELGHRLPQLFSYALSFAVLSLMWLRHHAFFRGLRQIDTRLSVLNLLYLALVAFLPYPTRLLGEYGDRTVSVVVYALTIALISLTAAAMRLHTVSAGLMARPVWRRLLLVPAVFLFSAVIAVMVSPAAGQYSWLLLLLLLGGWLV
jgi:uncharacterized membrane protein